MADLEFADALLALKESAALVEPPRFEVLRATGRDRVPFLHRLMTGKVATAPEGGGCAALLLDLKGHVTVQASVLVGPDDVRVVVPEGQGQSAAAALSRYAIMDDFAIAPEPDRRFAAVLGPHALDRLRGAGVALPADFAARPDLAHVRVSETPYGDALVVRVFSHGADGFWVWTPTASFAAFESALATPRASAEASEALRIAAGQPRWGAEVTSDVFPMEVELSSAIDYTKGCYLGQEPIVRIRDRGHINWRLTGLRIAGDVVPTPGDRLEASEKEKAGRITSAARAGGDVVALALVHVSVPLGADVRVHHGAATLDAKVVAARSKLDSDGTVLE